MTHPNEPGTARAAFPLALPDGDTVVLHITQRERALLAILLDADDVVPYEHLGGATSRLSTTESRLRHELLTASERRATIITDRGRGYRLAFDDPAQRREYGTLVCSRSIQTAWIGGRELELTAVEAAILDAVTAAAAADGRSVSISELVGAAPGVSPQSVKRHAFQLARKVATRSRGELAIAWDEDELRLVRLAPPPEQDYGLELDPGTGVVRMDRRSARLSPGEVRILVIVRARAGTRIGRGELRLASAGIKPYAPATFNVLLASLRGALLRVSGGRAQLWISADDVVLAFDDLPARLSLGRLVLDRGTDGATLDGRRVQLSPRRSAVVWTLMSKPGALATGRELARPDARVDEEVSPSLMYETRKVLQAGLGPHVTIRGGASHGMWRLIAPGTGLRAVDGLELDHPRRAARYGGQAVALSAVGLQLLEILGAHPGETFPVHALTDLLDTRRPMGAAAVIREVEELAETLLPLDGVEILEAPQRGVRLLIAPPVRERLLIAELQFDARSGFVWGPQGRTAFDPAAAALLAVRVAYLGHVPPAQALRVAVGAELPGAERALRIALARVAPRAARLRADGALELAGADRWSTGTLTFDPERRTLAAAGCQIQLYPVEADLVALVLSSPRRPVAFEQLAIRARAHGLDDEADVARTLAALSHRLRVELAWELVCDDRRRYSLSAITTTR